MRTTVARIALSSAALACAAPAVGCAHSASASASASATPSARKLFATTVSSLADRDGGSLCKPRARKAGARLVSGLLVDSRACGAHAGPESDYAATRCCARYTVGAGKRRYSDAHDEAP